MLGDNTSLIAIAIPLSRNIEPVLLLKFDTDDSMAFNVLPTPVAAVTRSEAAIRSVCVSPPSTMDGATRLTVAAESMEANVNMVVAA